MCGEEPLADSFDCSGGELGNVFVYGDIEDGVCNAVGVENLEATTMVDALGDGDSLGGAVDGNGIDVVDDEGHGVVAGVGAIASCLAASFRGGREGGGGEGSGVGACEADCDGCTIW